MVLRIQRIYWALYLLILFAKHLFRYGFPPHWVRKRRCSNVYSYFWKSILSIRIIYQPHPLYEVHTSHLDKIWVKHIFEFVKEQFFLPADNFFRKIKIAVSQLVHCNEHKYYNYNVYKHFKYNKFISNLKVWMVECLLNNQVKISYKGRL